MLVKVNFTLFQLFFGLGSIIIEPNVITSSKSNAVSIADNSVVPSLVRSVLASTTTTVSSVRSCTSTALVISMRFRIVGWSFCENACTYTLNPITITTTFTHLINVLVYMNEALLSPSESTYWKIDIWQRFQSFMFLPSYSSTTTTSSSSLYCCSFIQTILPFMGKSSN